MLIIRKDEVNNLIATVSMNKTLANPYYLFSFQHIASKERVSFIPQVINSNCRYDKFRFIEYPTTNLNLVPPRVNFPYLGQYYYSIYEQLTSGNTDPSLAFNKLESGRAVVIVGNDTINECLFEPYISNDENFSNVIYLSEDEQACITPALSPSMTPTPSITPTITPTPTVTPSLTQTNTPTPSITPTITPTTSCILVTQYLKAELQSCHNFQLSLWNTSGFTGPANALCDYVVSGTAYGDLGTVYNGTETILNNDHTHSFNLNPVLLPGECVSGFTVNNVVFNGCVCPTNLILP